MVRHERHEGPSLPLPLRPANNQMHTTSQAHRSTFNQSAQQPTPQRHTARGEGAEWAAGVRPGTAAQSDTREKQIGLVALTSACSRHTTSSNCFLPTLPPLADAPARLLSEAAASSAATASGATASTQPAALAQRDLGCPCSAARDAPATLQAAAGTPHHLPDVSAWSVPALRPCPAPSSVSAS